MNLEAIAKIELWDDRVAILVRQPKWQGGPAHVGLPLTMQAVEVGMPVEPTFSLSVESAQGLMDSLWQCGIRPTEGKGSAGALAAVQYHLEDMRKLVFKP